MRIQNRIRQSVSQIYDVLIPEGAWQQYAEMLDRDGHPNRRELCQLILVFGQHIELLENLINDLYAKLDDKGAKTAPNSAVRLRSPQDVQKAMDQAFKPQTTAFYLSPADWKILEKTVKVNDPDHGYGKEYNPQSGTEQVCLFYKDLPVFKE